MSPNARPGAPAAGDHGVRNVLRGGLLLNLLLVVYGSLVPLTFKPLPWATVLDRLQQLAWPAADTLSRTDVAVNVLLAFPLAFLWRALMPATRSSTVAVLWSCVVWLGCLALSASVEIAQFYFPDRTPALSDVAAQSVGAAAGLLLHQIAGRPLLRWLRGWWTQESGRPFALRLLHGWLVLLLIFSLLPLDLSISPAELYHKAKAGHISLVPFTDLPRQPVELAYEVLTDIALWLPVGALWALLGWSLRQVLLRGLLLAAVVELLQVPVISRVSSSTDVLSGALGCVIGAMLLAPTSALAEGQRLVARTAWLPACLAWALLVLAAFWYPFQLDLSPLALHLRWQAAWQLPFAGYFASGEFQAMNEMVRKPLMFFPLGLLWAGHVAQHGRWHRRSLVRLGLSACVLLAMLVEAGQLLMPGKVADFTDMALESLGGCTGLLLGLRLWGLWQGAQPAVPVSAAADAAAPATTGANGSAGRWAWVADPLAVCLLTVTAWGLAQQPAIPYNLRELLPGTAAGLTTALAVALVGWWLLALPLLQHRQWQARPQQAGKLLLWVPLSGLPAGLLLLLFAPRESLEDILGSPVWGGLDWLEMLLRYQALHAVLALAVTGASWLVARLALGRGAGLLPRWCMALLLWALPLHALVVTWAATDNLVELMHDGGGPLASLLLFSGLLGLLAAASALAAIIAGLPRRAGLLTVALLAWPLATAALWYGSERLLIKYGRVFSAAQFLLSSDRGHYAEASELLLRYGLACVSLVLLVALLQAPGWRRLLRASRG